MRMEIDQKVVREKLARIVNNSVKKSNDIALEIGICSATYCKFLSTGSKISRINLVLIKRFIEKNIEDMKDI